MKIGVISDTHGLVRAEALTALSGSDLIIHAGDVGSPQVLAALEAIAPVVAVRGNCDRGEWADTLPERAAVPAGAISILVIHDIKGLGPLPDGTGVVVSGHSHQPALEERGGVTWVNPGSAGRRRFRLPVAVARLRIQAGEVVAEIVDLG